MREENAEDEGYGEPCDNDAVYICNSKILFKKHGCGMAVCEEHRNQAKLCSCFEQTELVTCLDCEAALKEQASKKHFFIPGIIFILLNLVVFLPTIIDRLKTIQEDLFDKQIEKNLAFDINAAKSVADDRRLLEDDFSAFINIYPEENSNLWKHALIVVTISILLLI